MKKFLSLVILIFLLTSLVSCNNEIPPEVDPIETDVPETNVPQTDTPNPDPPSTNLPETAYTVVYEYTPTLSSAEDVKRIGIRVGDVIVETDCAGGAGQIFKLYEGVITEGIACDGGTLNPARTPIVKYSQGMDLSIFSNMGYGEITDVSYFFFDPVPIDRIYPNLDENAKYETLPSEPGLYCCRIRHAYSPEIDRSNIDPEIIDRLIGYMYFYVFIVVE